VNATKKVRRLRLTQDAFDMLCTLQPGRNITKIQKKYFELEKKVEEIQEKWIKISGEDLYIYKNGDEKILFPDTTKMRATYLSFFHVDNYQEILSRVGNISSGLLEKYEKLAISSQAEIPSDFDRTMYYGLAAGPLTYEKMAQVLYQSDCPLLDRDGSIKIANDQNVEAVIVEDPKQSLYNVKFNARMSCNEVDRALKISAHIFPPTDSLFDLAMNYGLFPDSLNWRDVETLRTFHTMMMDGVNIEDTNALENYLSNNETRELFGIKLSKESVGEEMLEEEIDLAEDDGLGSALRQYLDECDYHRAKIQRYYSNWYLNDDAKGNWELWDEPEKLNTELSVNDGPKEYWVKLKQDVVARNPQADVKMNAVVGIDFGTRSTIVAVQDGDEDIWPVRVGMSDYSVPPKIKHYENPTVIQFIDCDSFLKRYSEKSYRPYTSWEDIKISHEAYENLIDIKKSWEYSSFFSNLKQWAGGKFKKSDQKKIIHDSKGFHYELKNYLHLEEGDLDPIELYAYYLGLHINNMHMGIYLDYILSFPGTFSMEIKSKILDSFRKGIQHSLPESVFENETYRNAFRVRQGPTESAAYVACALEQYGIEATDDGLFYGVFDFGGGTADFDFGTWKNAPEDEYSYNYVLHHFISGGDRDLGGENLLELMAYYVFSDDSSFPAKNKPENLIVKEEKKEEPIPVEKKSKGLLGGFFSFNQNPSQSPSQNKSFSTEKVVEEKKQENKHISNLQLMRSNQYVYYRPEEGRRFPGMETLVSSGEIGVLNTRLLMEVLRPIWEENKIVQKWLKQGPNGKTEERIPCTANGYLCLHKDATVTACVRLFDDQKKRQKELELYVDMVKINEIIEQRVEKGVKMFFENMKTVYEEKGFHTDQPIYIFLGGNASKSSKVMSIFQKFIKNSEKEFVIFPPLGTPEADAIQKQKGIVVENKLMAPTGKSGVAFGLVMCREGSMIRVESEYRKKEKSKIGYYIGVNYRKNFKVIFDRSTECNQWHKFIKALDDMETFEFYYTELPEVMTGNIAIKGNGAIYRQKCLVDNSCENANIYFRFLNPSKLEYVISTEDKISRGEYVSSVYQVKLS